MPYYLICSHLVHQRVRESEAVLSEYQALGSYEQLTVATLVQGKAGSSLSEHGLLE